MDFDFSALDRELLPGARELASAYGIKENGSIKIIAVPSDHFEVLSLEKERTIFYKEKHEFFRGLVKAFFGENCFQNSAFTHLTYMNDCSRGAVLLVDTIKKLIRILAASGYDRLQLYTEDTYKIENRPMFGYLRGAYTATELSEIDAYASLFGIEVIPCIQTLGHLGNLFRWEEFQTIHDCGELLLCDDERTYTLIEDMFRQISKSFSSRIVHIGMDEAIGLGQGKHREIFGNEDPKKIFLRHLNRVLGIAKKYGFRCQMWSDMFFRLAYNGEYYSAKNATADISVSLPEGIELVYWDYYSVEKDHYIDMIEKHKQLKAPFGFAGGAWKWVGFAPLNSFSLLAGEAALSGCLQCGVKNILLTAWGDNGGEASVFSVLPAIVFYGEKRYGGTFKKSFQTITGCKAEDFMQLDLPNVIDKTPRYAYKTDFNKIFLYNDVFFGIYDDCAKKETREVFSVSLKKLRQAKNRVKTDYKPIFETLCRLLEILVLKYDICNNIRDAYLKKDFQALSTHCITLKNIEKKIQRFHAAFSIQWYSENKPNGMEIHDGRLGWLLERTRACRKRLETFLTGKIQNLPELEETRILSHNLNGHEFFDIFWASLVSVFKF